MSDINKAFMDFLYTVGAIPYHVELFYGLQDKFPQFNSKSKVVVTPYREVYLPETVDYPIVLPKKWYKRNGIKSRIWRGLGELFNKTKIYNRGMILKDKMEIDTPKNRSVRLSLYGIRTCPELYSGISFYVGYDAVTDTLFVCK